MTAAATTTPGSPQVHDVALQQAVAAYLPLQRWFGAKTRRIAAVRATAAYPVGDALLCIWEVGFTDGGPTETYQLPLAAMMPQTPADGTPILLTQPDGTCVVDAVHSQAFREALFRLTSGNISSEVAGDVTGDAAFRTGPPANFAKLQQVSGTSRISPVEQSNTSIFYADAAVLKLYRRLQPGANPDIEVPRFLAQQTSFRHTPAYLGELAAADRAETLVFAQAYAPNHGDAWKWFGDRIAAYLEDGSPATLNETVAAAALIGQRTAELHLALATRTADADFVAERFTPARLATDAERLQRQLDATLEALNVDMPRLPAAWQPAAARLLASRAEFVALTHGLATAPAARFGERIRVHGDYHLGQLLRTDDDFLIVDFEGEPARALAGRRTRESPLRDVAGMLRSFTYAVQACLQQAEATSLPAATERAVAFEAALREAFLAAYVRIAGAAHDLLPRPAERGLLLRAMQLEKALYELLYELNNRPAWIGIPLAGVLTLLHEKEEALRP